jgi:hypothetical protein
MKEPISDLLPKMLLQTLDRNILLLVKHGWYVPAGIKLRTVFDLPLLFESRQSAAAENIIFLFYDKNLKSVQKQLIAEYYRFTTEITEAFTCHTKGMYHASTLLFLHLSEALCAMHGRSFPSDDLRHNLQITQLLGSGLECGGYFTAGARDSLLRGCHPKPCGKKESLQSLSLLCMIADFYDNHKNT